METNFTNIKERILYFTDFKGFAKEKFFDDLGVTYGNFKGKAKEKSLSSDILAKIVSNYPEINSEWLLTGNGEMLKTSQKEIIPIHKGKTDRSVDDQLVPLYDLTTTLGVDNMFGESNLSVPLDYIKIPNLPKCDGALYARGDSMYPLIKSGDIVIYKVVNDKQSIIWGEMYMAHIINNGDEYFFTKFVQRSDREGYALFVSQNQHHQPVEFPIDSIQSLALIKATIRINTQI